MYENDTYSSLNEEYQAHCRRLEQLASTVSHDNSSALAVFEHCQVSLRESKDSVSHYLHELKQAEHEEKAYYLHSARQALQHFKELLEDAEIKLHDVRPVPPFMY